MTIDRKKIIYAILKELNNGNKQFDNESFNVEKDIYHDVIKAIINANYAENFKMSASSDSGEIFDVWCDYAYITVEGIEFLERNSTWGKAYGGLKEFASWIPGL